MRMSQWVAVVVGLAVTLAGVAPGDRALAGPPVQERQQILVHLSHFTDDLHAAFMAFKVANTLQKHGAEVTIFLDLEGARLAHSHNDLQIRWGESDLTLGTLTKQFHDGGGTVIVCPHCAHHVGVNPDTVRDGVQIGTEDGIAQRMLAADKVIDY